MRWGVAGSGRLVLKIGGRLASIIGGIGGKWTPDIGGRLASIIGGIGGKWTPDIGGRLVPKKGATEFETLPHTYIAVTVSDFTPVGFQNSTRS